MISLNWSQHRFQLLPAKALHWRDANTLIIADPHFGKAAAFRSAGIPVPTGTTLANLNRLDAALRATEAKRLIIVGDFLHARAGRTDQTMTLLEQWRRDHAQLDIVLVRGNHDLNAGDPPPEWNIKCVNEPWIDCDLVFCHEPRDHDDGTVIAGHVHPCVKLHDVDGSTHRAPCFLFRKKQILLPAFGSFTGGHPIRPRKGDRVFVVGPEGVIEVCAARTIRSAQSSARTTA